MAIEFNGVTLPDLPAEILEHYPYVVGLASEDTLACLCCAGPMYCVTMEGAVIAFATGLPGAAISGFGNPGWAFLAYTGETWLPLISSETEPFLTNYSNSSLTVKLLQTMFYANHDVLIATTDGGENVTFTDGVYFPNSEVSLADEYVVESEILVGIGDSVRNATGVGMRYSLKAMKAELDKLSKGAIANCNAVANMNTDKGYLSYYSDGVTIPTGNIASIASCIQGVIKRLEFPNVETVPNSALSTGNIGMVRPKEIVLNSATTIEFYAFTRQSELLKVIAPKVTELKRVFGYCVGLTEITKDCFPEVTRIDEGEFEYCTNLTRADFPKLQTIDGQVFRDTNMTVLILRNDSQVCTWEYWGTYSLINTPLRAGKGVVLVPAALVSEYESYGTSSSGNTWRDVYSSGSRFLPLEQYTVDGTLTGDIDWAKVDAELAKL